MTPEGTLRYLKQKGFNAKETEYGNVVVICDKEQKMRYEVGDKVRIRRDLSEGIFISKQMISHAGEVATITKVLGVSEYEIDIDNGAWVWGGSMFEDVGATDKTIRPDYYKFHGYDVFDIADYFGLSFPLGNAIKYILRHKDENKRLEDLKKARKCLDRAIELMEGKANENGR